MRTKLFKASLKKTIFYEAYIHAEDLSEAMDKIEGEEFVDISEDGMMNDGSEPYEFVSVEMSDDYEIEEE